MHVHYRLQRRHIREGMARLNSETASLFGALYQTYRWKRPALDATTASALSLVEIHSHLTQEYFLIEPLEPVQGE